MRIHDSTSPARAVAAGSQRRQRWRATRHATELCAWIAAAMRRWRDRVRKPTFAACLGMMTLLSTQGAMAAPDGQSPSPSQSPLPAASAEARAQGRHEATSEARAQGRHEATSEARAQECHEVTSEARAQGRHEAVPTVAAGDARQLTPRGSSRNESRGLFAKPQATSTNIPVRMIQVEGNQHVSSADILDVVVSRIGQPANEERMQRDVENIRGMGAFTTVTPRLTPYADGVSITYHVMENPSVERIVIEGNRVVATEKLVRMMETKPGRVLNTRVLATDLTVINRYYDHELGFVLQPGHVLRTRFDDNHVLTVSLQEGAAVRGVALTGNTVIASRELQGCVKTRPGNLFNQFTAQEDSERIARLYERKDYLIENVRPSIDRTTGMVTFHVVESVVEDIRIEGNSHTTSTLIRDKLHTRIGKVARRKQLEADIERMNSTGYFDGFTFEPEPGSEAGRIILVAHVKEHKTGEATFGLGYLGASASSTTQAGLSGMVSVGDRNFDGVGHGASASWQRGSNSQAFGLTLSSASINRDGDSMMLSLYQTKFDELQQATLTSSGTIGYGYYNDHRIGASLGWGHDLNDTLRLGITARREHAELTQAADSSYTVSGLGKGNTNSIAFTLFQDTRDDRSNPKRGGSLQLGFTVNGGILGGYQEYLKTLLEGRTYVPMGKSTLAMRVRGGIVQGGSIPSSEYFYLGGVDTLRGYGDNQFYGRRMAMANVEYRFPILGLKQLSGTVFTDMGSAWGSGTSDKLHKDVGVGLRLVFPSLGLGVIRIDHAAREGGGSRTTVGLGQDF